MSHDSANAARFKMKWQNRSFVRVALLNFSVFSLLADLMNATVEIGRLLHLLCFLGNLSVRGGASTCEHLPFSYQFTYRLKLDRHCEIISFRTVSTSGGDHGNEKYT